MAVVYNIKGTSQTEFQIGKGGPKLVKTGSDLEIQTPGGVALIESLSTTNLDFNGFAWPNPEDATGGQFVVFTGTELGWQTVPVPATFDSITATSTGASQDIPLPYGGLTVNDVNVYVNGLKYPVGEYTIDDQTLTISTGGSGDTIEITCPTSYVAGDAISVRAVQIGAGMLNTLIPSTMNDLSDVAITSPTANQVLKFDGSNWINAAAPATVSTLNDLTDVTIGTLATGNILQYNGSDWVNVAMGPSLPNGGTVGQVLAKNSSTNGDASWANANIVPVTTNATTSYTLVASDVYVRSTSSSATAITVPPNSSVAYPTGTQISIVQAGTGQITVTAGAGVTINKASPATLVSRTQFSVLTLTKVGTDEWDLAGDMVLS